MEYFSRRCQKISDMLTTGNDGWGGTMLAEIAKPTFVEDMKRIADANVLGNMRYQNIYLAHNHFNMLLGQMALMQTLRLLPTAQSLPAEKPPHLENAQVVHMTLLNADNITRKEALGFFASAYRYAVQFGQRTHEEICKRIPHVMSCFSGRDGVLLAGLCNVQYPSTHFVNCETDECSVRDIVQSAMVLFVATQLANPKAPFLFIHIQSNCRDVEETNQFRTVMNCIHDLQYRIGPFSSYTVVPLRIQCIFEILSKNATFNEFALRDGHIYGNWFLRENEP